jgi:hypothetical protein
MDARRELWLKRLPALFEIPAPDAARARRRIQLMERTLMVPAKVFFAGVIFYSFNYSSPWVGQISSSLDVTVETVQLIFWFYILLSRWRWCNGRQWPGRWWTRCCWRR